MRGFQIRKRATRFFHRLLHLRRRRRHRYASIDQQQSRTLLDWLHRIMGSIFHQRAGSGYMKLGHNHEDQLIRFEVPKGHLAVYVGQKDDDFCRVVVPVIYFNHPLFGRLLTEAEEKFGFHHPGRITIPCPVSEFESITTRIEASVRRRRGAKR